ncbi:helix-turn-helix domain-containing protein [Streptomyces zagrosensis]|uniref:Transcriptional regulator with XRE-family HTH domain n=1 Tax=Streptomyces zagrosensis TaxID=1042984 RepID=A0A7W9Q3Y8_9ACTN|nr:helix-turn-helix transcriptional regulator [Streptomyces zagrosensis]MBB5933085.1 transcriptional regulator with XRE-family HTH domain [Streptomyces zagrosensis]
MPVKDAPVSEVWAEFGRQLRHCRRRAGLTQQQLGVRVGFHHSLVSKWESGKRELPTPLVRRLDSVLGAGGALSAIAAGAHGSPTSWPGGSPWDTASLFLPVPGGRQPGLLAALFVDDWPASLSVQGPRCPLHARMDCAVPALGETRVLLARLHRAAEDRLPVATDPDTVHGLAGLLSCQVRMSLGGTPTALLVGTVERVLRSVLSWAESVHATGTFPTAQLRLAADYAQLAGRLRMERGQSAIAMAWFCHGLRWAQSADDVVARGILPSDLSTLARLDGDATAALGYARAIASVDPGRGWIMTLTHVYQARAYAVLCDGAETRRQVTLARRRLAALGRQDEAEAPWLYGAEGVLRVESAVGGALRDLAAATGDRATARDAVQATADSLAQVPARMTLARLLLTVRLADCHASAGDPDAALALAGPVLEQAGRARQMTISRELHGLESRLTERWGQLHSVRDFGERLRASTG